MPGRGRSARLGATQAPGRSCLCAQGGVPGDPEMGGVQAGLLPEMTETPRQGPALRTR